MRADECSRITRMITRILRQRLFPSEDMARAVAAEVAEGLIEECGGEKLYVPIADRRAGLTNHDAIEQALRGALTIDQLQPGGSSPPGLVADVAVHHGVSVRTVFRVLERMRAQSR